MPILRKFASPPKISSKKRSGPSKEPDPTVIGQAYGGGFYAGQIGVSGTATHYLVVAPRSTQSGTPGLQYKNTNTAVGGGGAASVIDGPLNTSRMVADGNSSVYPAAYLCENLTAGGFTDWYLPAKNELEVCYYNLKPSTDTNDTSSGINTNAVPQRASNYTSGTPARTSASNFQYNNGENFDKDTYRYWSSTEAASDSAWYQYFKNGYQTTINTKDASRLVRAVRRVAV